MWVDRKSAVAWTVSPMAGYVATLVCHTLWAIIVDGFHVIPAASVGVARMTGAVFPLAHMARWAAEAASGRSVSGGGQPATRLSALRIRACGRVSMVGVSGGALYSNAWGWRPFSNANLWPPPTFARPKVGGANLCPPPTFGRAKVGGANLWTPPTFRQPLDGANLWTPPTFGRRPKNTT